jgi:ferric-dicitrate binding protein FerR (iron transport regulator)
METHENIPQFLVAYLQGEANPEQEKLAEQWLNIPENAGLFRQLRKINKLTADLGMLNRFDTQKGKQQVVRKYRANRTKTFLLWIQRVAAILFIPALLSGVWYFLKQNELKQELSVMTVNQEVITKPGTKSHLFLPDSTEVWLNSSSVLRFPSVFRGNERRINLQGEAIFKVFSNKKKPFIVGTSRMDIEAVGTEFNVSVYPNDLTFSTTLAEGKVKITDKADESRVIYIDPGVQVNYDILRKTYQSENVCVEDVIAWRNGVLIFNETPFYEVVAKLGRWFNADIQITDKSIANYRFTGTFTSESLDQVMELLTLTTPISYTSSKREVLTDKTYSKQEIRIGRKTDLKRN